MVVLRKPQAFGWLRSLSVAGLLATLAANSGCQTATGTGAAAGGAIGAGVGAIASRCPGGALIGGLIGAGTGAIAGAAVDGARERKAERAVAADVAMRAPSVQDIISMTQNALPPAQIIEQIRTSGVVYRLTPDDLVLLNKQGVNDAVIREMQDTAYRGPRRVYAPPPVVVAQPVYVGPGYGYGYGYGYGRGWR